MFYPSQIPVLTTATKGGGGWTKFAFLPSFVAKNIKVDFFFFLTGKQINVIKFTKNYSTFYPNNCRSSQIYGFKIQYPGSRQKPIPNPRCRVKNKKAPSATLIPREWVLNEYGTMLSCGRMTRLLTTPLSPSPVSKLHCFGSVFTD